MTRGLVTWHRELRRRWMLSLKSSELILGCETGRVWTVDVAWETGLKRASTCDC